MVGEDRLAGQLFWGAQTAMATPIEVLMVEDSEDDAALVLRELARAGFEPKWRRVETAHAMREALTSQAWDVVLCDFRLPTFDAPSAIATLRETGVDVPIIVVSGTVGEEIAVATMRAGAADYVLKQNLTRLGPAVQREIAEARSRRRAQRALALSEEYAAALVRAMPDMVFHLARDGTVLHFVPGKSGTAPFLPPEEFLGRTLSEVLPESVVALTMQTIEATFEHGGVQQMEYTLPATAGDSAFEARMCVCAPGEVIAVVRDVTSQRSLERQMRAAQRMEAVGRLAGGISHDFNNLLAVIQTYGGFLIEQLPEGTPAREDANAILDASARATRLTSQLLAFSRRQMQNLAIVDLNQALGELDKMLRRILGEDIDLVTSLAPRLGLCSADVGQIEQIIMNLVVNARDAMPKGGKLTIETGNVALDGASSGAKGAPIPPGRYVMLAVSDTGGGMDQDTLARVFEPFFTTKAEGTGLGLSTVYGIVGQSGGYVSVYSELGKGTSFKVYLPAVDASAPSAWPQESDATPSRGGSETILLVEDELLVRKAAARILESRGYRVISASNGEEALTIAAHLDEPLHLLLTDVIMPVMGGKALADRLLALRPGLALVYMSGYTENAIVHQGVLDSATHYVQKPFSAESLLSKVRSTLDRRGR